MKYVLGAVRLAERDSRYKLSTLEIPSSKVAVPYSTQTRISTIPDRLKSVIRDRDSLELGESVGLVRRWRDTGGEEPVVRREGLEERHRFDKVGYDLLLCEKSGSER